MLIMEALQIVLNNHHSDMIDCIKIRQNAEMVVDEIIDDFLVFSPFAIALGTYPSSSIASITFFFTLSDIGAVPLIT